MERQIAEGFFCANFALTSKMNSFGLVGSTGGYPNQAVTFNVMPIWTISISAVKVEVIPLVEAVGALALAPLVEVVGALVLVPLVQVVGQLVLVPVVDDGVEPVVEPSADDCSDQPPEP